jgi:hypothetical protein
MAATLHCGPCGDRTTFKLISWPRVQEGYKAIEEKYGISALERNEIAHLAGQAEDGPWALQAFLDIGQKWDKGVWHTRDYYQYWRSKALRMPDDISKAWDESEQATQTPEGMKYNARLQEEFEKKYSTDLQKCGEATKGDATYFVLGMKLDEHGEAKEIRAWPPTKLSECLIPKLSKQTTPPPIAPFWVFFSMNTKSLFGISNGTPLPEAGN